MRALRSYVSLALAITTVMLLVLTSTPASAASPHEESHGLSLFVRTLNGSDNNPEHPRWGQAGALYLRVGRANYTDGVGAMVAGPSPRAVSDRVFNDIGQNIFSERGVTQWGWIWGQFLDHDIGLRDETSAGPADLLFDARDPLESFVNDLGVISFSRTPAAPGTGVTSPRQQVNTISSYIDASNVYGVTAARDRWLRAGPLANPPGATLMLTDKGYLPRRSARGDVAGAPRRSSRSRAASSAPRSSASPTPSSCPRSASVSTATRAMTTRSMPAWRTSSRPLATGRTA